MLIVADRNIPFAEEALSPLGEVALLPTSAVTPDAVRGADILVIRSEIKVDRDLLAGSAVKFVATTTIGFDHMDLDYLASRSIGYANAPGCNADSVANYVAAALLRLACEKKFTLRNRTLGVIGVGNVGSLVAAVGSALGMHVLPNDPPRARREGEAGFVGLDEAATADIVTLHVPLTRSGADATHHLWNGERLAKMKPGAVLINTARGGVVETTALKRALADGRLFAAILDVWEDEPNIDAELPPLAFLATPHIAGHSLEGKVRGLVLARAAICRHFGIDSPWKPPVEIERPSGRPIDLPTEPLPIEETLARVVAACYDIAFDHRLLMGILDLPRPERRAAFSRLRHNYRVRREFSHFTVRMPTAQSSLDSALLSLGFRHLAGQ